MMSECWREKEREKEKEGGVEGGSSIEGVKKRKNRRIAEVASCKRVSRASLTAVEEYEVSLVKDRK